jgi:hypothetical protein
MFRNSVCLYANTRGRDEKYFRQSEILNASRLCTTGGGVVPLRRAAKKLPDRRIWPPKKAQTFTPPVLSGNTRQSHRNEPGRINRNVARVRLRRSQLVRTRPAKRLAVESWRAEKRSVKFRFWNKTNPDFGTAARLIAPPIATQRYRVRPAKWHVICSHTG